MANLVIKKAEKSKAKLRLAFIGPAGSGKTYSALAVASQLGKNILVIDSEHGSAAKYADIFDFSTIELDDFNPRNYVEAIEMGENEGFNVIVVDSLTHAWSGKGGALEIKDSISKRTNNSYTAWGDVTPLHIAMIEAMLGSKAHIIATMRTKTEYVQEKNEKTGKTAIRKVGSAPVQRDGMEYEFDVVVDIDIDHTGLVSKSRCPDVDGKVFHKPGANMAGLLLEWLNRGREVAPVEEVEQSGIVYCHCVDRQNNPLIARYVRGERGAGWLCHHNPAACDFRLKDTGQAGLRRPEALSSAARPAERGAAGGQAAEAPPAEEDAEPGEPEQPDSAGADRYGADDLPASIPDDAADPPKFVALTDAQHRSILALGKRLFSHDITPEEFATISDTPIEALSRYDASAVIDRLRFLIGEKQAGRSTTPKQVESVSKPLSPAKQRAKELLDQRIAEETENSKLFVDLITDANVLGSEEFSEFMDAVNDVGLTLKTQRDAAPFLEAVREKTGERRTVDLLTANDFYVCAGLLRAGELKW